MKEVNLCEPRIALAGKVSVAGMPGEFAENVVSPTGQKVINGSPVPGPS
jgi:hypothetical protein